MTAWKIEEPTGQMGVPVLTELRLQEKSRQSRQRWAWWNRRRVWTYGLGGALAATVLVVVVAMNSNRSSDSRVAAAKPTPTEGLSSFQYELPDTKVVGQAQGQQGQPSDSSFILGQQGQQGQHGQQGQQGQQGQTFQRPPAKEPQIASEQPSGPMVIRTARLTVITKDFDGARSRVEAIVRQSMGYVDQLTARGEVGTGRTLSASLRLPSDKVDAGLVELRKLGRVREESQNSSDVTSQYVDLQARLTNARNTEQRLLNLLRERTGKLEEVVNVEREISRVREEIERMEAQRKDMTNRVQYATIQLEVAEEYRAAVEPSAPSAGTRLRNALIGGYQGAVESVLGVTLFILLYAPMLLLWSAVLLPFALLLRRLYHVKLG